MDRFFDKFPTMYYNGVLCKDLTRRIVISEDFNPVYPYTIEQHLRPDQVADFYYDDPELDWMVFMANKVVDPYYDWYLDQFQFHELIKNKYGSAEIANRTILFWRNNWYNDSQHISVADYENHIDRLWRKYYEPVWGPGSRIMSYKRRPDDHKVNVNRINQYEVTYASNVTFQVGEPVDFINISSAVGQGMVAFANDTHMMIQSTVDDVVANNTVTKTITGLISGGSATSNAMITVTQNISDVEAVFWSPVTAWDYEEEINESKKDINLVAKGYHTFTSQEVSKKLKLNANTLTGMSNG